MSKRWNEEQLKAIQTRNKNILVSASAGSGKTGVLVQRLVELVTVDHIEIDEILAMTFSEDAANEMKKRLSKEITTLAKNANDCDRQYLNTQLSKLSNAHISTIHSFCYSIIKKYYYYLNLSSNRVSNLCDESMQTIFQNQAIEEVIQDELVKNNEAFSKLCNILSPRPENLEPVKEMLLKIANMANSQSDPIEWLQIAKRNYEKDVFKTPTLVQMTFMDYWLGKMTSYRQSFEAIKQQFDEHAVNEEKRYATFLKKYEVIQDVKQFKHFDELRNLIIACARLPLPTSFDATNQVFKESKEMITSIEDEILSVPPVDVMNQMTAEMLPVIHKCIDCVTHFFGKYERIKDEQEVIDFSDMEHFALRLLKDHEEVRNYYRNLFKEIMVDEFQDSNDVQDDLVTLISKENNVFRVGDVKQSIYGFRHALPKIMQRYKEIEDEKNTVIRFNKNYRSDATVVEFNNVLFQILMNIEGFDSLPFRDEDLSQIGLDSQNEKNEPIVFHALNPELKTYEDEKINKDVYKAEYIAHEILRQSKEHAFKDFAVLVRNNSKMEVLKSVFEKYHIPYYMNQKTGFYESRSIQILISLLSSFNDPTNDTHFAAILTSILFNMDSNTLAILSKNKKSSYYEYLMETNPAYLHEFERIRMNSNTICDTLQECFKWNDFYETCSLQDQTNCDYFYEIAQNYQNTMSCEWSSFLLYLENLKQQQTAQTSTIGKNDNVVRFMSIHNSKGLEFPIVYVWATSTMKKMELSDMILCDSELGLGFNIMQLPYRNTFKSYQRIAIEQKKNRDEIEEELRILYVATTRAKKQLHIVDFLNPKLEIDHGINYLKVNARKGTTSWILQALTELNRSDLFRIQYVDEMWESEPLAPKEKNQENLNVILTFSKLKSYHQVKPMKTWKYRYLILVKAVQHD